MDRRINAALCSILLLLALGNPTSAEEICYEATTVSPLCLGFTCKLDCWVFAKANKSKMKIHKCLGKGYKYKCYCEVCRNY
ncbi:hypothetical protein GUJ93_ZPchr0008g12862 [Zizania palustris]|uniref:Knottin scorpion toxin-like domain-containing protein n=1 Tax=Zizania palustris TaxID=103762 RepID=A0A8J5R5V1_ZIZPA|nr:hypothetical protein GUJ93_ZPchr0008g12862 [Zizania palustris]